MIIKTKEKIKFPAEPLKENVMVAKTLEKTLVYYWLIISRLSFFLQEKINFSSLFVHYVHKRVKINLPIQIEEQIKAGKEITGKRGDEVLPGDVVYFKKQGNSEICSCEKICDNCGWAGISIGNSTLIFSPNDIRGKIKKESFINLPAPAIIRRFI